MMETFDKKPIDEHIIKNFEGSYLVFWTILRKDRNAYKQALMRLLNEGKLMNDELQQPEDIVVIVRIINHINLDMKFIANGIALKENAKANYYWNVINKKVEPVVYSSKMNSIGKVDKYDGKPGWAEKILTNKDKE